MSTTTSLKYFAPEICSLICQDPTLNRNDLNSICSISPAFQREAQRLLSYRFPCLRGTKRIKSWSLSLIRRPCLALDIEELVLVMPPQVAFPPDDIAPLIQALRMCINLKELAVLSQWRRPGFRYTAIPIFLLDNLPFTLTKFVNDYFSENLESFKPFLKSQRMTLETLELYSDPTAFLCHYAVTFPLLKTLACPPPYADDYHYPANGTYERLRLDFEYSKPEIGYERNELISAFSLYCRNLKSLAVFLKQQPHARHSHFLEIMDIVAVMLPHIKHLQIHQFLPMRETNVPLSSNAHFSSIETLVLRPPPRLPIKSRDDPNLCAYVGLRTADGRREAAVKMMTTLETLTRLVFVDYEYDYEFRRDLTTGIITGEELITLNEQEWALVN